MLAWLIVICIFSTNLCDAVMADTEREEDRCEAIIREIIMEDRTTVVDESPSRLHSIWLSQECEVRAGPEYVIRKYKFFENGTFLLLRHHYAEESCSVASHTVLARGSIEILENSRLVLGATEARVQLETVHVVPLNRQVAHKFGRRVNASCGPQSKWRPYAMHLVYEHPAINPTNAFSVHGPDYNSLQSYRPSRKRRSVDCLESLGIEFTELKLFRVQKRRYSSSFATRDRKSVPRVELLLGGLPRTRLYRKFHRPTSLQTTPLLRSDTATGCPICGSVARGTEYSPPLLHVVAPLPALIGGLWLSTGCESTEGGFWSKRLFHVYSGDRLWTARWDYYTDSQCTIFLYASIAAGSYQHRADRRKRNEKNYEEPPQGTNSDDNKRGSDSYRHILRNTEASMARSFEAMLRGNQRSSGEVSTEKVQVPSGTTELQLQVVKSFLIPGNGMISVRCGVERTGLALTRWPRNCVPRAIQSPSVVYMRARLGVNWNGQYTLLLGQRDENLWEPPLRRCSLSNSVTLDPESSALRYGIFSSVESSSSSSVTSGLVKPILLLMLCRLGLLFLD